MLPTTLTGAASAVTGHREGGNEENGVAARGQGDQSFFLFPLCFWPLNLSFCVLLLLCFSVFVSPRGPPARPDLSENPFLPVPNKNTCSARDPEQQQLAGQACHPCNPCTRAPWGCHGCNRGRWLLLALSADTVRAATSFTSNFTSQVI